jgi:hypothetical protein
VPQKGSLSLRSTTCPACGGAKGRAKSLCYPQYKKLPRAMRAALYARVGAGYEEALLDAFRYLDAETFHPPKEAPDGREVPR